MSRKSHYMVTILAVLLVLKVIPCLGQMDGCAAWSKQEGDSANIYIAKLQNGLWGNARKITNQEGVNITPTVSMAKNGDIWLAWVRIVGDERTLRYFTSGRNGERIGEVSGIVGKPDFSPSIAVDRYNTPWLTWTIDDGTDEDIYFSRWNGSRWQPPQRVHPDNVVPDITPTMGLGANGQPWISWEGFNGNGYVTHTVFWHGNSWRSFSEKMSHGSFKALAESQKNYLPELPKVAVDRLMGSLYISGAGEIQSMSERIFKFKPRSLP